MLVYENWASKIFFLVAMIFFSWILISKMGGKNESDNKKNHEADSEIGFCTKSISMPYGHATAMRQAWELMTRTSDKFRKLRFQFPVVDAAWKMFYLKKYKNIDKKRKKQNINYDYKQDHCRRKISQ